MSGINAFDAGILTFVQAHCHNPVTDAVFPVITYLGEAGLFWLGLLGILALFQKTRRCGLLGICAVAVGFLLGELILKGLVCRPRPFVAAPELYPGLIPRPSGYSFPSGHTCASFAAASVLWKHFKKAGTAALVLAALIGFSRLFLFVHYPTDVLAGMALGVLSAAAVFAADRVIQAKRPRE